jgi:DNA-directed RNA polymerase subunit RPC12/RpoP
MAKEQYRCGMCGSSFDSKSALEQHNRSIHSHYTCEACGDRFGSERDLDEHNRQMHPETQRTPPGEL